MLDMRIHGELMPEFCGTFFPGMQDPVVRKWIMSSGSAGLLTLQALSRSLWPALMAEEVDTKGMKLCMQ